MLRYCGMPRTILIEACVEDLRSADAAIASGAARLELCDNLHVGGTTPSHGLLSFLLDTVEIPVCPLIRPRGGDYCYSRDERRVMARDVDHAVALGATTVVVGALTPAGEIDIDALIEIALHRDDIDIVFHRAFDQVRDPDTALDTLIEYGFDRILTAGTDQGTAWDGRASLARLVTRAAGQIDIMAGGGVRPEMVSDLVTATGVHAVHASLRGDPDRIRRLAEAVG